jgi:hypothetical protein
MTAQQIAIALSGIDWATKQADCPYENHNVIQLKDQLMKFSKRDAITILLSVLEANLLTTRYGEQMFKDMLKFNYLNEYLEEAGKPTPAQISVSDEDAKRRPSLGIMPENIWIERFETMFHEHRLKRYSEVKRAINEYVSEGLVVPFIWIDEYNRLIAEIEKWEAKAIKTNI